MFLRKIIFTNLKLNKTRTFILFGVVFIYLKTICNLNNKEETEHLLNPELNTYLNFVLQPSRHLCRPRIDSRSIESKFVFAYAVVRANDFEKRQTIRQTWANASSFRDIIKVAFIMGLSNDEKTNELIKTENKIFSDIIQGNFLDSYRNLSYGLLTVWKWIKNSCPKAKYIFRVQDDVILNSFNLKKFLLNETAYFPSFKLDSPKSTFICKVWKDAFIATGKEYENHQHYISPQELSQILNNITKYPTYCSGPGIMMTKDLAKQLYLKSYESKVFWIDDVYEGLLANRIANVSYIHQEFVQSADIISKQNNSYLLIEVDRTVKNYLAIWKQLEDINKISV